MKCDGQVSPLMEYMPKETICNLVQKDFIKETISCCFFGETYAVFFIRCQNMNLLIL